MSHHSYFYTLSDMIESICYNIYNEFADLTDTQLGRAITNILDSNPFHDIYHPGMLKCHMMYYSLLRMRIKKMIECRRKLKMYVGIIGKLMLLQNRTAHRVWAPPNGIENTRLRKLSFLTESFEIK